MTFYTALDMLCDRSVWVKHRLHSLEELLAVVNNCHWTSQLKVQNL